MASGDPAAALSPKHLTYSKSNVPIVGALIDYMDTSIDYVRYRSDSFPRAEKLHAKTHRATLSPSFMATVCLILGLVANVKLEVVTLNDKPLEQDLHIMLLSKEDNFYVDDIDASSVMLCLEASDIVLVLIGTSLIRASSRVVIIECFSTLCEFMYK